MAKGRKPDFQVAAMDKRTELRGNIGAAWIQPDGSIQIKLNGFVRLDTTQQDLLITLFPADRKRNDESRAPKAAYDENEPPY